MTYCSGFADLTFAESAGLAFARALDQAATDAYQEYESAWVIEDRRITFSLEAISRGPMVDGMKRLLGALVREAVAGEAILEVHQPRYERWARRAAPSRALDLVGYEEPGQTIRTRNLDESFPSPVASGVVSTDSERAAEPDTTDRPMVVAR